LVRFFLDESLPPRLCGALQALGFECESVAATDLAGATDEAVYGRAQELSAVLLTLDLDFADVRRFPGETPIIVLRLHSRMTSRQIVEFATIRLVRYRSQVEELQNAIMILEPRRVRIRRK
jgi:predicted nuclease of predicted toxin-antitoxin system